MDKYEYKIRADEIKELIAVGEYVQAADIADTIDWRRVKSVMMLCTISDLYKINRRYEDARDMLLLAYEHRPGGRTICYSLCELSIKMEEYVQAVEYYKEFVQIAPKDSGRYILQYKLYEAQDVSLEERIEVLEELKKRDYREKWAYELAYLYHRVGLATRCVEECDELILWFGEGKYVIKAMELKMLHQPLTPGQQEKYDMRFGVPAEQAPDTEQTEYAAHTEYTQPDGTVQAGNEAEQSCSAENNADAPREEVASEDIDTQVTKEYKSVTDEELEIHVKTVDVGQFNTMNLQAELAEGLREVLGEDRSRTDKHDAITRSIMEPMLNSDTETLDYPEIDEVSEDDLGPEAEQMESSEVFFGETGEIGDVSNANTDSDEADVQGEVSLVQDATGEIVMEQMRQESVSLTQEEMIKAEPPKELANVLSQEADGQISLVMPESENLEKQITGQMNIEDILAEWERMKRENEEKRKEVVRQRVLQQTGTMFTEFEASVRDGLLEQLESGEMTKQEAVEEAAAVEETMEEVPAEEAAAEEEPAEEEPAEEAAAEEEPAEEALTEAAEPEETDEVEEIEEIAEAEGEEIAFEEVPVEEPVATEETEEAPPEPAVTREKAKVRSLTREEKELFAPFIQSKSAKEQLVQAIDGISLAAYTGNVIITGEEGMDTLTLAKDMIREVQLTDSNFSGKIAKISGPFLNKKDVAVTLNQLQNGALIIQKASGMNNETVQALHKALQQESLGIIVVLVDEKKPMNKLLEEKPQLVPCFTQRMDVEALSNEVLVAYGKRYAREREYSIDVMGVLALHTRIEELQTSDHAVTVLEVKDIVDQAIHHANKKTIGHFFDVLFAKRYDEEDMIILNEKDFA